MVQIWCFIVINLVAALERTSLSKPAVLFFLWLGHAILNYPHYINCHIWGIIGGYTGVNRYTPPHFQTHPYHGSMGDPDPVEKRTRSASCDPWPRGWSRSKESASRVVWAQSLRGSGRRKTRSPMAKSTAWSACTQWKRTGWNVQRLGFETKHRHTEVTQPKKCNRHEVGFDSTGEYSPAPEEKCWLSKHVQNNWIHKGGVLLSNHWDPPSLRYSAVSVPRTALTAVWAKQETSKMLREHWLGIRSACLPTPFCPTALMVIAFVLYQFTAKRSLSNLLSKLRGFHCHFTSFPFRKNGAGFSRVLSHKTHAAQPFFRSAKRMVSSQLEISRGRQSELLAVSFRGLAGIAFCPLLWKTNIQLAVSKQLTEKSTAFPKLPRSPTFSNCQVLSGVGVPLQLVQHSGATLLHCRVNGITSQPQDDKLIKLQYGKKPEAPGVENRSTEKQNEQWAHMQSSSFGSALNLCFLVQCHCLTPNCATYGSAGVQWSHKNLSSSGVPPSPRREMVST